MTSLLTITFSGNSAVLETYFLPEILLNEECDYSCALLDLIIKNDKSEDFDKIIKVDVMQINCDVISGSYINGVQSHSIHQFATSAAHVKGQILVENPKNLNYFPIKIKNLQTIQISIFDQSGKLVDFYGGDIICRINIKREPKTLKTAGTCKYTTRTQSVRKNSQMLKEKTIKK